VEFTHNLGLPGAVEGALGKGVSLRAWPTPSRYGWLAIWTTWRALPKEVVDGTRRVSCAAFFLLKSLSFKVGRLLRGVVGIAVARLLIIAFANSECCD
jgi:hypothetical protein